MSNDFNRLLTDPFFLFEEPSWSIKWKLNMVSRSSLPGLPQKRASTLTKLEIKKIKLLIFLFQFTGHSYKNIYAKTFTVYTPIHELQMSGLSHICLN